MVKKSIQLNKRGAVNLILLISVLAGLLAIGSFAGIIDTASITGSGSYIQRPVFYYDKCEQTGSLKYSIDYSLPDNGAWLYKPSVSDSYDITVKLAESSFLYGRKVEVAVCNSKVLSDSNCRTGVGTKDGDFVYVNNVRPNEEVWVKVRTSFGDRPLPGTKYQVAYQPYGLRRYNVLGGSNEQVNPNSCVYPSRQSDTILSENLDKVNKPEGKTTDEQTLQPNEVRWYVAGYLTSAEPSIKLTYKGQDAWCRDTGSAGEIYAINEIRTVGGTYKVASADWSDFLGSVTCCPGEKEGDKTCSNDFKWVSTKGTECSAFKSCGGSDWTPFTSGKLVRYACESGKCVQKFQEVECASDFDCRDSNKVCDLSKHECVAANVNLDGQVIETIPDSEDDCYDAGGKWIKKTTEDASFLNVLGFGEPEVVTEEYCQFNNGIRWGLWITLGIILAVIIFFWKQIYSIIKMLLAKVGIRI